MLTEACTTRKPVYIFDSARADKSVDSGEESQSARERLRQTWWVFARNFRYRVMVHRLAMWFGPRRMRREFSLFHEMLISTGRAVWFGQTFPAGQTPPPLDDLPRAVARVRQLFAHGN